MTEERLGSSELLDLIWDLPDGEIQFIKLCEKLLNAKITFDNEKCEYIMKQEKNNPC